MTPDDGSNQPSDASEADPADGARQPDPESDATAGDPWTDEDTDGERPVVLVIDDEERICEAFSLWLDETYEVWSATSGKAGLTLLSESVDVVLLDRHMPGLSGDEVLERIREREYGCRVAMVTGVDPDFDIVELPFDEYVTKPVDGEALHDVVERLLRMQRYDERLQTLLSLSRRQVTLEAEKRARELAENEQYRALVDRRRDLNEALDEFVRDLSPEEAELLFAELPDANERH